MLIRRHHWIWHCRIADVLYLASSLAIGRNFFLIFSSFHELMQSCGVRRPSVRPSVYKRLRKSLLLPQTSLDRHQTYTTWSTQGPASSLCSRSRSRSKVTWYRHFCDFTKIASSHRQMAGSPPNLHTMGLHPGCAQGQGQGERSRDTGISVMSRNVCYTVRSHVLSLHALTLWSTMLYSPSSISIRQI